MNGFATDVYIYARVKLTSSPHASAPKSIKIVSFKRELVQRDGWEMTGIVTTLIPYIVVCIVALPYETMLFTHAAGQFDGTDTISVQMRVEESVG